VRAERRGVECKTLGFDLMWAPSDLQRSVLKLGGGMEGSVSVSQRNSDDVCFFVCE